MEKTVLLARKLGNFLARETLKKIENKIQKNVDMCKKMLYYIEAVARQVSAKR